MWRKGGERAYEPVISFTSSKNCRFRSVFSPQLTGTYWELLHGLTITLDR